MRSPPRASASAGTRGTPPRAATFLPGPLAPRYSTHSLPFKWSTAMNNPVTFCRRCVAAIGLLFVLLAVPAHGQPLPVVQKVSAQPLATHVGQLRQALDFVGRPLSAEQARALDAALAEKDEAAVVRGVQQVLDPLCLVAVHIN